MLIVKNITFGYSKTSILEEVNFTINSGENLAIIGESGSGKSTLSKVLAGHPAYTVTDGEILYDGVSILDLEPEERSHLGIFLAFQ